MYVCFICTVQQNVGLTTWKDVRYLVAIWGDEGLETPLTTPSTSTTTGVKLIQGSEEWYATLVNERHERNWKKIERFVEAVREMPTIIEREDSGKTDVLSETLRVPRSFDVVGDVAICHDVNDERTDEEWREIAKRMMERNKAINIVALRDTSLKGTERAVGELRIIAGQDRSPLMTTHSEYGIKCVIDLNRTFFSPRMAHERLRICNLVARAEEVLVLFAGVAMEALQIAGRTEATRVTTIELNDVAVECTKRSKQTLERSSGVKCPGAADRLNILHGDALRLLETLPCDHYHRILAPRPKEGTMDGDLGEGDAGAPFLSALLRVLKHAGGECHWYDFVADHEFPTCERSRTFIEGICHEHNLHVQVLHVSKSGSVAMRQLRVCIDFRVSKL